MKRKSERQRRRKPLGPDAQAEKPNPAHGSSKTVSRALEGQQLPLSKAQRAVLRERNERAFATFWKVADAVHKPSMTTWQHANAVTAEIRRRQAAGDPVFEVDARGNGAEARGWIAVSLGSNFQGDRGQRRLTPKQERFAHGYVALGSAAEAYRRAYDAGGMLPTSVHEAASRLLRDRKVAARIREVQKRTATDYGVTRMQLLLELDEAFAVAKAGGKASAMIAAVMAKARLCGLDDTPPPSDPSREWFPALCESAL